MNTAPVRSAKASASATASSTHVPCRMTSAPYPRVASTLGSGAPAGMTTVAAQPSRPAANATPWAWLPALAAAPVGVVARAGRDDAAGPFGVGEPGDPGVGPAHLERPSPLEVLALH